MKLIYVKVGKMYVANFNQLSLELTLDREYAAKYEPFTAAKIVLDIGKDVARLVELEMVPTEKVYEIEEFHIHNGKLTGFSQREIKGEKK